MKNKINFIIALAIILVVSCNNNDKPTPKSKNQKKEQSGEKTLRKGMTFEIDSLTNIIEQDPNNAKYYMERAELWLNEKKHIPADHDLKKAVELDSTNENYLLAYGNHSALMNNTRLSKMVWEKCANLNPENKSCRIKLSELHFFVQEYKKSITYANEVLKVDKDNHLAYFFLGMSLLETGDTLRAVRSFQNSIENKPDFIRSMEMLASIYTQKNDLLAIDYYKAILNINPNHSHVHFNMGVFFQNRKDYNKSLNFYEIALQLDPENSGVLYNTGFVLQELKQYEKSIKYFSKIVELDKLNFQALFARGYVYELDKRYEMAKKDYQSILLIKPGYGPATARLAELKK